MRCHACQTEVPLEAGATLGFREACAACGNDLHVCLNCAHYDSGAYNHCREPSAERVLDGERANRCEWFRAGTGAHEAESDAQAERDSAKAALDALFSKD